MKNVCRFKLIIVVFFSFVLPFTFKGGPNSVSFLLRRVKVALGTTAEPDYIPPSPLATATKILDKPISVVIDVSGFRENPNILSNLDALFRFLSGNPNVKIAGVYGIDAQEVVSYLRVNVAHGAWRGMDVKADQDNIYLNGTVIPVRNRMLESQDLMNLNGMDLMRTIDAVVFLSQGKSGFSDLQTFENLGGEILTFDSGKGDVDYVRSALLLAAKVMLEGLPVKKIDTVRIIEPGGSRHIDLVTEKEDFGQYVQQYLGREGVAEGVKIDRVVGAVESGGKQIVMQFEVKDRVTTDQVNTLFKEMAKGPLKGIISYADNMDVIASGDFIDVDSGRRFSGPTFVFDSRLTTVKNGVVNIYGWTSDYAVARTIYDKLISIGLDMQKKGRILGASGDFIPPVEREVLKKKVVKEPIRIAVNGSGGRIGTAMLISMIGDPNFNPVAISGVRNVEELALMLRQDSVRGHIYADIQPLREGDKQYLVINGKKILCLGRSKLSELPWSELNIDVAVDATGAFKTREPDGKKDGLRGHLEAGAEQVGLTVPPDKKEHSIPQLVPGVNQEILLTHPSNIISFASCTTNNVTTALAVLKRLLDRYGIVPKHVHIQTIHAVTKTQPVLDGQNTKPTSKIDKALSKAERGIAAPENIIVTSTGAKDAAPIVLGWPKDIFSAEAMRVGNLDGSVSAIDVTLPVNAPFTTEILRKEYKDAADSWLRNILYFNDSDTPFNSRAIIMQNFTSLVESSEIEVNGNVIHLKTWYDNEWGYTQQVMRGLVMIRLAKENPGITKEQLLELSNRLETP